MNNDTWGILSRKVLSSVMVDKGAIFPVMEVIGDDISSFAPDVRGIAAAVFRCLDEGQPPFVDAVVARLTGDNAIGYAYVIAAQFNPVDNSNIVTIARELGSVARLAKVKELGAKLSAATKDDVEKLAGEVAVGLESLAKTANRRPSDSQAVDKRAWEMVVDKRYLPVPSGLGWFDQSYGGFWPGENYWFVAPYKSRKTTIARHCVIASARAGFGVSFIAGEGQREIFTLDCQAAMATEHLIKKRIAENSGWAGFNSISLSAKRIMMSYRMGVSPLSEDELWAIGEARKEWQSLPIYVYDGIDQIRNLSVLRYTIKRDKLEKGIRSFWMDYSQLFGSEGTLFERQSATAMFVQALAVDEKLAACAISQQNEEAVKYGHGKSNSPGVKGGGDAPAASDVTFESYVDGDADYMLHLNIKLGRSTGKTGFTHLLNVASGCFVDKWFSFKR